MISKILVPNPEKRLSIEEIKVSEFYLKGKELFNIIYSDDYIFENINSSKEDDKNLSIKKHISHEIKSINTNNTYETNKTNKTNPNKTNELKTNGSFLNKNDNDNEKNNKRHRKKLHLKINGDNISNINSINGIKKLKNNEKLMKNLKVHQIIKTEGNDSKSIKNDKNNIPRILGIRNIIVSDVAGAINKTYKIGDIMLLSDHINTSGYSPLIGDNIEQLGSRFPNMLDVYPKIFRDAVRDAAKEIEKLNKENTN